MNLQWIEDVKPTLELQEFLAGLEEIGRIEQGICSSEWWLEEPKDESTKTL